MSQKTSVFNLEQLMDYLGSETFVGVTGAGYEPYKDQSGELRDTERFLLLDDKGFVWSLWVYETEEGFGAEAAYSQSDLAQYGLFFPESETLEVQIYREPCWLLEAAELVYGLVNRIPAGKLTVPGQYCIPPDELRKIQEEACAGRIAGNPVREDIEEAAALCGSAPGGVSPAMAQSLLRRMKAAGGIAAADLSGPLLRAALRDAAADILKKYEKN